MKSNYKQRLQRKDDQKNLRRYSIVYCSQLYKIAPKYFKNKKKIERLQRAILGEFDRILVHETYNNEGKVEDTVWAFENLVNRYELPIDYAPIRERMLQKKTEKRYMYEAMLIFLTICYHNTVGDYIKLESTQKAILQELIKAYIAECKSGLIKVNNNRDLFAERICNATGYVPD